MSYVPPIDASTPARQRLPRLLDPVEIRILGSLIEKQLSTPEYYPLTLNALLAACNQKSNREPVTDYSEAEIERALSRLQDEKLIWRVMGGRAVRFDHNLDTVWQLRRPEKAVLTLLFLRGAQTPGELRGRSERLNSFTSVPEVEGILRDMAAHSQPLVRELSRRPGQKESRWMHTAAGAPSEPEPTETNDLVPAPGEPISARVLRLEEQVANLTTELRALKDRLGES